MSPSWRERLVVDIGAHDVGVRRWSRGWRPRLLAEARAVLHQADAPGVQRALAGALDQAGGAAKRADADVTLGTDWVRFALLDSAASLRGADERDAAARHALRRVFGDAADTWRVSASLSGRDSLLAAAIEQPLFDAIGDVLTNRNTTLTSVRPSLVHALNHCRGWLGQPSWFVLSEPGRVLQCFSDGQQLRSIRSHRVRRPLHQDLHDWIEQGRLVDGLAEADAAVVLAHRGTAAPELPSLAGRVRLVNLDALKAD